MLVSAQQLANKIRQVFDSSNFRIPEPIVQRSKQMSALNRYFPSILVLV